MLVQKSFLNNSNTLYIIPTPIGNLEDISKRAIEILKNVNKIYCEDTRVTKILLQRYGISNKLESYFEYNEDKKSIEILNFINEGNDCALVSDAGYPTISDPGYKLVKLLEKNNINIVSIPGAMAGIVAFSASGMSYPFIFYGFLQKKKSQRQNELNNLKDNPYTIIFYESCHRLKDTLKDILNIFGNRYITLARELTKKFEEYIKGNILDIIDNFDNYIGEFCIIVDGKKLTNEIDYNSLFTEIERLIDKGLSIKDSISEVSKRNNIKKNLIYNRFLESKK